MLKVYDEKEQLKEILSKLPKPRIETSRPSSQPNEQQLNSHKVQATSHQNTS